MPLTPEEEKRLREEIKKELENRELTLRANKEQKEKERQRKLESQLREKIREEEEEKYFTEKGYVKYVNHRGLVEWLTPQEAERRKKGRRSKKTSSRHKMHQRKQIIQAAVNIGIILIAAAILLFLYKFNPSGGSDNGSIAVSSDLPGCKIFLDGIEINRLTPHRLDKITPGTHYVSVYKEGFSAWPPMLQVSVRKNKTTSADFTLHHSTFLGEIVIESNLTGYDLYVDGLPFKITDSRVRIPVGYHVISAVKAGYLATPSHRRIVIEQDKVKTLRFQFNPEEEIAYLQISSNRKKEYIFLDGKLTGIKAAGNSFPVKSGTYEISLHENGFITTPESKILNLMPDEKKLIIFHSSPVEESQELHFHTPKPGVAIIIDGNWTSLVTPVKNVALSPGSHYINFMRGDSLYSRKDILLNLAQLKKNDLKINF